MDADTVNARIDKIRKNYTEQVLAVSIELLGQYPNDPVAYKRAFKEKVSSIIGKVGEDFIKLHLDNSAHEVFDQ